MFTFPHITHSETEFNSYNQSNFSKNRHSLFSLLNNHLVDYPTPLTITYAWGLGSLAGIFLVFQIITGIILSLHYAPHVSVAFDSLEHIMRDVNNGWLLRYLHANGASFFFFVVYIHIARGLYYFSYMRSPFVWMTGMAIFGLMMATAFLGYVLPWGQMSFWGATVITNLFSAIPLIGQEIAYWLWGGFSVDNPTLNRFFGLHFLLPFAIVGVMLIHLVFLHRVGSSNPLSIFDKNVDKIPFFPYFYWKDWVGLMIICFIYLYFVFFTPDALGHPDNYMEGNPMVTPAHIVPEWYFLPYYAILRSIPDKLGGVIAMAAAIVFLFLLAIWGFFVTKWNKHDAYEYSFLFFHTSFTFNFLMWLFFFNVILLGWIGGQPVTPVIVLLRQMNTMLYFWWLMYFPLLVLLPMSEFMKGFLVFSLMKKMILGIFLYKSMSNSESMIGQELNKIVEFLKNLLFVPIMNVSLIMVTNNQILMGLITFAILLTFYFGLYKSPSFLNKVYLGEMSFLLMFSLVPLFLLITHASNWMYFYLLFELSALSTVLLMTSRRYNPFSVTAGFLYYFVSILASMFLLIAILCFYIESKSLELNLVTPTTQYNHFDFLFLTNWNTLNSGKVFEELANNTNFWALTKWKEIGTIFLLLSFCMKMGIAPFHSWVISVSIGAPLNIMAYLQTIYKTTLFMVMVLLWTNTTPFYWFSHIFQISLYNPSWLFSGMGGLTFFICTMAAFNQTGLKQFWAYASTGTIGFLILLLAIDLPILALMYLLMYTVTSTLFFSTILAYQNNFKFLYLTDLQKLRVNPLFAFFLIVVCFILAGLPPSVVFYLKLLGYYSIFQNFGLLNLFMIIIIHLISIFLYLRLLKMIFFDRKIMGDFWTIQKQPTMMDYSVWGIQTAMLITCSVNWSYLWTISSTLFQYLKL